MSTVASGMTDKVAGHLVDRIATALGTETVASVLERIRGRSFDCLQYLYVVDAGGRLCGVVPLTRFMAANGALRLAELMDAADQGVAADLDQESALAWARHRRMSAPPVAGADGRLLGCLPPEALIEIGGTEHAEDISRLAGILHQNNQGASALEAPPWRRALDRMPWLLVGLAGSVAATLLVASFEARLTQDVAIAFFIPAIVYLADAVGTQTEAVVVRGLSFRAVPTLSRLIVGELSTGLIVGIVLGAFAVLLVYAGFGDGRLAVAVGFAVAVAGGLASGCGLLLPWLLARCGFDPAFGSGPVATVIQDVLSLAIYFWAVQLVRSV